MAALLVSLVSSTLYQQRTHQASRAVERLVLSAAPYSASGDLNGLQALLDEAAREMEGRLLVIGADGSIQLDTSGLLIGIKPAHPEITQVLSGESAMACAVYPQTEHSGEYTALCAAAMADASGATCALLLLTPVTELHSAIVTVEKQMLTVFAVVAAAAMIAALVFSLTLTRPITALTAAIRRMGRGDLSARVEVHATGEMKELADSYNAMARQIEDFDNSRSTFVANASHELKTPLATMKLLLENLIYQPDMPKELREEFMQDMNHEIDRLTGIITDLLTLTQMDSHADALKAEDVDLSALTEETLHPLLPAVQQAGLQLMTEIAPGIRLRGDRGKLSQIVYNLTDNAVKYTPSGGEIRVTLAVQGQDAVLTVADNGIGIPPDQQAHVFDRFYRVDKARSRATGGTGLGLPIVRQMVQLHGGTITLSSEPGQGTIFTVMLPLRPISHKGGAGP